MRVREPQEWAGWLVELAWELSELGVDSVVRFPTGRPPSMEILLAPGRHGSTAGRRGRAPVFAWSRGRDRDRKRGQSRCRSRGQGQKRNGSRNVRSRAQARERLGRIVREAR
ncbi:hypothetical protein GCM10009525_23770 [Streptosporangium amethystogenes subsp. fukuiense]